MKKIIYVVIGTMEGADASIDFDCVFDSEEEAIAKRDTLAKQYENQHFVVEEINIAPFVAYEEIAGAIDNHADAVADLANAFHEIHRELQEFVTCACSVDSMGRVPTTPTFTIRKEG